VFYFRDHGRPSPPPVALAAFAAAPIAKGERAEDRRARGTDRHRRLSSCPYMAVYAPELMLQGDKGFEATLYVVFKALLAVTLWGYGGGSATSRSPMNPARARARLLSPRPMLVVALPITDELGFGLAALVLGWHIWRSRDTQALTV
jgi:TRAP-type uncharacterized transport system fused permease subunit